MKRIYDTACAQFFTITPLQRVSYGEMWQVIHALCADSWDAWNQSGWTDARVTWQLTPLSSWRSPFGRREAACSNAIKGGKKNNMLALQPRVKSPFEFNQRLKCSFGFEHERMITGARSPCVWWMLLGRQSRRQKRLQRWWYHFSPWNSNYVSVGEK